ncbi:alpha-1-antitrypsin-like protein CM55-SI [Conger conger]|uniref:alpha-1-antitrypsin-like protein CM55-SI n=1 Tax=Conger conger TaxID=82655 RepID=UPI002A59EBD5|nr:alpha-1-antitrypsin-like protein CM55-SI [Conger conger]
MRVLLSLCAALVLLWSTVQCHHNGDHSHHGNDHSHHGNNDDSVSADGSLKIYQENLDFAFRLYKHISAQPDSQSKNVFFSPLSVSVALAALSVGARGKTHQQLFEGLGFNSTEITTEEVNQAFQHIHHNLNEKTGIDLSLGNALFIGENIKPRPEFLESMKRYYESEGFSTDFSKPEEAKEQINKYVNEKTKGKISELVKDVDPLTVMYLINYIYFKGKWNMPFDPESTMEKPFFVDNTTEVNVQMMIKKNHFHVYHDVPISTQVLQLPYNDSVSMLLLLPEAGMPLLEKAICSQHLAKWLKWLTKTEYRVYVPKFNITTSYLLKDILSDMGMPDIFENTADFTGIIDEGSKLKVSKVVHQASLSVDEAGSTAAAGTGLSITLYSAHRVPFLKFDRPFMFLICNTDTKSILFMGKIVNPLAT